MKRNRTLASVFAASIAFTSICTPVWAQAGTETEAAAAGGFSIVNLKTDGMTDPLGMDDATPSFSWQMQSSAMGAAQSSYQITVADPDGNTVWDSGVVESADSVDIPYEGEELAPRTAYSWTVSVTDVNGETVASEPAAFETAFLSGAKEAWDGAEFIGAGELQTDSASTCNFKISADVQIPEGSDTASFIFGADDFRLSNEAFNIDRMAGENYVRLELDVSGVTDNGGAVFNVYRVGYFEGDTPETPLCTVTGEGVEELNGLITSANAHQPIHLEITVLSSEINISIDGTPLTIKEKIPVNRMGQTSSENCFPMLASVGFAAEAGQSAVFSDYTIENAGNYSFGTLLGADTGAGYSIFEGMDGITVDSANASITVDGGESGVVAYADPTYSAAPMVRTEFEAKSGLEKARLYVTAHGIYELGLNGQTVAEDEWYNPGVEEYDAYLAYNTYDVTELINEGGNALGAVLGEGFWTGNMTFESRNSNYFGDQPSFMAKLVLTYEDGSEETVITSPETWQLYTDGPVRYASMFQGERYDASKEADVEGWTEAGFDASAWVPASVVETRKQFANAEYMTRTDKPVHVIRTLDAASVGESLEGSGAWVYDMGENVSGVPMITIPDELAKPGETLTIRYAEILYPEIAEYTEAGIAGMLMVENYRAALVTDFYTMKESGNVFLPRLTQHGYRYIEITGLDSELPAENVKMLVLSSLDPTTTYESSNELTNTLYANIQNSTTSNYISIPTDCPQRNERMGWVGDAQVYALSGSYVADTYNFMQTWMKSLVSSSGENGMSKQFVPAYDSYTPEDDVITHKGQSFGITWNAVAVTVPYYLYMQTGRLDIVEENIENIYAYLNTLMSKPLEYKNADGEKLVEERLSGEMGTLADHLARVLTDKTLLGNAVYYELLNEGAVLADAVGDADKAEEFRAQAEIVKQAWNECFLDENGITRNMKDEVQDTQASYATPLRFGIISDENLEKVLANYERTIAQAEGKDVDTVDIVPYTLTTGFNATVNLLPALSDHGLNDTAFRLFESSDYASWLYPVTQGATSIWERWNSFTGETGFNGNNAMNSFNHYSLGAVCEWMMGYQVGIKADPAAPGYQHIILQPTVGGDYSYVKGSYDSVYGTIESGWTAENGALTSYDAVVPANTTATLYLPASGDITAPEGAEGGETVVHNGTEVLQFELSAGTWHFE